MRWTVAQLGSYDLQTLAGAGLRWWLGELLALVPERVRYFFRKPQRTLAIDLVDDEIALRMHGESQTFEIGRVPRDELDLPQPPANMVDRLRKLGAMPHDIVIRLPPERLFRKTLQLPLAA